MSSFGDYTILERLGAGGMSRVDLARRTVEEARWVRLVAIKRIRQSAGATEPSLVRMFCDEARIGAELQHQNIAQIYDFGREGDELFLIMEYVPGLDLRITLAALQARGVRMPLRFALSVLLGVLAALGHAHSRRDPLGTPLGIVHRDVNPRNVMLSTRGEVKLIDFGVALAADRLEQTEAGKVKGKFTYMAPEQLEGRVGVDGRADLFAVGLMMTEMINGRSPFANLTEMQAVHRIVNGMVPALEGVPDDVAALQRRALAVRVEERYSDAATFADAILQVLAPMGGRASEAELAQWLRDVDPQGIDVVERRIRAWRAGLPTPEDATPPPPPPIRDETRTGVRGSLGRLPWWSLPVGAGAALILSMGVGVGTWIWWTARHPVAGPPPAVPVVTLATPTSREVDPSTPGTLNVYTEPDGLQVTLDGKPIGTSPLIDVPCAAGPHKVEARSSRGRVASEEVTVPPGAWASVQLTVR